MAKVASYAHSMKWASPLLIVAATFSLCACQSMPDIPIDPRSESIRIVQTKDDVPAGCRFIGRISESDGMIESGKGHYYGTEERAVLKLRNSASQMGANLLHVLDKRDPQFKVNGR